MSHQDDYAASNAEETTSLEQRSHLDDVLPKGSFLTTLLNLRDIGSEIDPFLERRSHTVLELVRGEGNYPTQVEVKCIGCYVGSLPPDIRDILIPLLCDGVTIKATAAKISRVKGKLTRLQVYLYNEQGYDLNLYILGRRGTRS